jgi:hypothetical protein
VLVTVERIVVVRPEDVRELELVRLFWPGAAVELPLFLSTKRSQQNFSKTNSGSGRVNICSRQ